MNGISRKPAHTVAELASARQQERPFAIYCHSTAGALPVRVSLWTILNRTTQSRTDAASSGMDDATRTIEIERKNTTQFENTELSGEPHEVHRGLKGCMRDERCDAVPLAWMLQTCTEYKLQVETSMRTFDSMGIAGSDLGRPALAGLSRFTTWVEETIAKTKSCDDAKAQAVASERSATTRAATSASRTIDAVERPTRLNEGMTEPLVLQHEILLRVHEAFERFKAIYTVVQELHMHCMALVQQRWASIPEQADAAHAADSKETHTDIHQAPNVSHTRSGYGGRLVGCATWRGPPRRSGQRRFRSF